MDVTADMSQTSAKRPMKSAAAFRTISEVAAELDLPQHVLRFWESKFPQIRPMKRGGGRRYYRPEDMELLRRIRSLLYDSGYTIKGVQKILREGGRPGPVTDDEPEEENLSVLQPPVDTRAALPSEPESGVDRAELLDILRELEDIRRSL
jgi:DNA-binding transcriptional MerR regulator